MRKRTVLWKHNHPSSQLYNGPVADFAEAMRLYVAQHMLEFGNPDDWETEEERAENRVLIAATQETTAKALRLYEACVAEAKAKAVQQMRAEGLEEFAAALETGDYAPLSI